MSRARAGPATFLPGQKTESGVGRTGSGVGREYFHNWETAAGPRMTQNECQALCLTPFLPHRLSMALFPPPFFPGRSLFHESFSRFLRGVEMTGVRLLVFQPSSTRLSRLSVSKNPAVE